MGGDFLISGSKAALVNGSEKAVTLLRKLNDFRLSGILCDVVIRDITNGVEHRAHACVLATQSELFHGVLAIQSAPKNIQLEGLQADILNACLEYLYGNVISLELSRLNDLKSTAELMKIDTLTKVCEELTDYMRAHPEALRSDKQSGGSANSKQSTDNSADIKIKPVRKRNSVQVQQKGGKPETDKDNVDCVLDEALTEIYLYEDAAVQPSVRKQYCTHCCTWFTNRHIMKQHLQCHGYSTLPTVLVNQSRPMKPALLPDVYHEADAEVELSARRMLCTHCDQWFRNRKALDAHREEHGIDKTNSDLQNSLKDMYREVFLVTDQERLRKRHEVKINESLFHEDDMHLISSDRRVFCKHCNTWFSRITSLRNHCRANGIPDPMSDIAIQQDTLQAIQNLKKLKCDPALESMNPQQDDETHYCDHCDTFFADKTAFDKHCSKLGLTENTKPEGQGEYSPSGDESTDTDPEIEENEQNRQKQVASAKQGLREVTAGPDEGGRLAVTVCDQPLRGVVRGRKGPYLIKPGEHSTFCDHCNRTFANSGNLQKHQRRCNLTVHYRYGRQVKRRECKKVVDEEEKRAMMRKNMREQYRKNSKKLIVCAECGEQVMGEDRYKRHYTIEHEQKFKCKICGKCFPNFSSLKTHESRHLNIKPFSCAHCEFRAVSRRELKLHEDLKHGKDTYLCSKCDFVTTSSIALQKHENQHKDHECPECDYTGNTSQLVNYHRRIVHDTGPISREDITCPICGKEFQKRDYKKHHMRTVHGISLSKTGVRIAVEALEAKKEDERLLNQFAKNKQTLAMNQPRLKRKRKAAEPVESSGSDSEYDNPIDEHKGYEQLTASLRDGSQAAQNLVVEEITNEQQIVYINDVAHYVSQDFGISM